MLMLSGYTLGFFFPKQAKLVAASQAKAPAKRAAADEPRDLNETRPDADSESRELPASFYFYRYF